MERQPLPLFENLRDLFTDENHRHNFVVADGFNSLIVRISETDLTNVDKLLRKLSPHLTEQEKERRISVAKQIARFLKNEDAHNQISGIYLFGSMEKDEARFSSDVDIAVCIPNIGSDPYYEKRKLSRKLEPYLKETKIAKGLKIHIVLVKNIETELTMVPTFDSYSGREPTSLI